MSAQAVGGAVAHNPISIIIPCHRVVGTGKLDRLRRWNR
ncbi:MAG: MGMT family protein [Holdemania massiliensis]